MSNVTVTPTGAYITIECFSHPEARDSRKTYILNGHAVTTVKFSADSGMYEFRVQEFAVVPQDGAGVA